MPLRQLILVDKNLFSGIQRLFLARQDRVLLPLLKLRVIVIAVVEEWRSAVGLFDPADDLVEESFLQGFGVGHHHVGVVVLGVEVGDDLGVGSIPEPIVVVDASVPKFSSCFGIGVAFGAINSRGSSLLPTWHINKLLPTTMNQISFQQCIRILQAFVD